MHLSNSGGLKSEQQLAQRLFKIKESLDLSRDEFARLLEVDGTRVNLFSLRNLTARNLEHFCHAINVNVDNLFHGNIDYYTVARQFRGDKLALPERYENEQHHLARLRVVQSVFELLKLYFGYQYAKRTLAKFQVGVAFLEQPTTTFVSWQLIDDLFKDLEQRGLKSGHFWHAGTRNVTIDSQTKLGSMLTNTTTPRQLYTLIHEQRSALYDHIFDYEMTRLENDGCTFVVSVRESATDLFQSTIVGGRQACVYKQGVIMSFLRHLKNHDAHLTEKECMYTGGKRCVYEVSWNSKATPLRAMHEQPAVLQQ